mgnify:CR=1 FL=1
MLVYRISLRVIRLLYGIASFFNEKARLFTVGRKGLLVQIKNSIAENQQPLIWVHCASLGEFEQGRPVMEGLRQLHPGMKIMLTFFSPSGYEIRKKYEGADFVFYLPWDSPSNARKFIDFVNPKLAVFVKYEFWHFYLQELKRRRIPVISVSSIFRPDQIFFQWYGATYRKTLKNIDHFFVQNQRSVDLLRSLGITQVTLAGDTRFDRVHAITQQSARIEVAEKFKDKERLMVIGSMWPEDLEVLAPFINEHKTSLKFIIAPHELSEGFLKEIEQNLNARSIRYSQAKDSLETYSVLIIDNIGMLSRLYRYGEYAFVGGSYGKGLHNILEAACVGIPIFFGNKNYEKFQEARELIMRGGAFAVADYAELKSTFEGMINRPENYLLACEVTKAYVNENLGATQKILSYCQRVLTP